MNLCNIYAPNIEDPSFFHKVNKLVESIFDGHTIIAGDSNQVLDGVPDKTTSFKLPKDRMAIKILMKDLGLTNTYTEVQQSKRKGVPILLA